jgi:hypothetical protein
VLGLLTIGSLPFFSLDRVKNQTVGVSMEIYDFYTPDDRAMLVQAFEKGQDNGLVAWLTPFPR